jgi:hypothetical protein
VFKNPAHGPTCLSAFGTPQPNHSLEATWDAPRCAIDGPDLLSWEARVGASPGASAQGRWVGRLRRAGEA